MNQISSPTDCVCVCGGEGKRVREEDREGERDEGGGERELVVYPKCESFCVFFPH